MKRKGYVLSEAELEGINRADKMFREFMRRKEGGKRRSTLQSTQKEKQAMPDEVKNPVCPNPKCSHFSIQVSDVEARRNRCGHCFVPLDGTAVKVGHKPTARVTRVGHHLTLKLGNLPIQ